MVTVPTQEGIRVGGRARETEGDREFAVPYAVYSPQSDKFYRLSLSRSSTQTTLRGSLDRSDIERFRQLVDEWHRETGGLALASRICSHPSYLKIIGMGKPVIPLILNELVKEPDHWFLALRVLTDANPVQQEQAGNMGVMAEAWLKWGRDQGYFEN